MKLKPELWEQVKILFEATLQQTPEARTRFLQVNCSDPEIREEVYRLIANHNEMGSFLSDGRESTALQSLRSPSNAFVAGQILADRFEVTRFIARGGMGEVYEAWDLELQMSVAIKAIRPDLLGNSNSLERFKKEVQLSRQVTHPNVCRVYDLFRHSTKSGTPIFIISMEYLRGETLAETLRRVARMKTREALPLVLQITSGLEAAHNAGILHRDLKPENIMVVPGEQGLRAVVMDFGVALRAEGPLTDSTSTMLTGTPAYMSPEQLESGDLTPASDIYSLGLVIYRMVTGRQAFRDIATPSEVLQRLSETPTSPRELVSDLDHSWATVIVRCLERKPSRRYASARSVGQALDQQRPAFRLEHREGFYVRAMTDEPISDSAVPAAIIKGRKWAVVGTSSAVIVLAAAGALVLLHVLRLPAKIPPELTQKRLTFNSSDRPVSSFALSADGEYLAYADLAGIHVKLLSTGEERLIPKPKRASANALYNESSKRRHYMEAIQPGTNDPILRRLSRYLWMRPPTHKEVKMFFTPDCSLRGFRKPKTFGHHVGLRLCPGRTCGGPIGLVVAVMSIISLTSPHAALAQSSGSSASVTISASVATGIGLASAAVYQIDKDSKWKDYEDVVELAALNRVAKLAANGGTPLTTTQYANLGSQIRTLLDGKLPQNHVFEDDAACLRYAIDALVTIVASGQSSTLLGTAVGNLENLKFTRLEYPISTSITNTSSDPLAAPYDPALSTATGTAYQLIADIIQETSYLAYNDAQYAAAVNPVLDDFLGLDTTSSYVQIQSQYAGTVNLGSPSSDGSFAVNPQNLESQYAALIADVQSVIDTHLSNIETQATVTNSSAVLLHRSATVAPKAKLVPADASGASTCIDLVTSLPTDLIETRTDWCTSSNSNSNGPKPPDYFQQSQDGIAGLSKLVGLSDPQTAAEITSVGGAIVTAGKAISQLEQFGSNTSAVIGDLVSGISAVSSMFSLVGAGASIISALSGVGASNPNAAIMSQLQKISTQIAKLQKDMDAQFAKVDATLNTILGTLDADFAYINTDLQFLEANQGAIEGQLLDLQSQLIQLEQYIQAYAQAQEVSGPNGFDAQATLCLGQLTTPDIDSCEDDFYNWAYNTASSAVWELPVSNYTDSNIYNVFENSVNPQISGCVSSGCPTPFAVDVNYLAQFPAQNLLLPSLSTLPLPNPDEWTRGIRAYLELAHEWPRAVSGVSNEAQHLSDMIASGTNLTQATQAAQTTNNGGTPTPNTALFNGVVNKYSNAVSQLQNDILGGQTSSIVTQYGEANNLGWTPPNGGYTLTLNLWAGPNQVNTYVPSQFRNITSLADCSGDLGGGPYTAQTNFINLVPNVMKTTEQLTLGTVSACLNVQDMFQAGSAQVGLPYNPFTTVYLYEYQLMVEVSGQFYNPSFFIVTSGGAAGLVTNAQIAAETWQQGFAYPSGDPNYGAYPYLISSTPIGSGCQTLINGTSGPSAVIQNVTPAFANFVSQNSNLYICGLSDTPIVNLFGRNAFLTYDPTPQLNALSAGVATKLAADQQELYADIAEAMCNTGSCPKNGGPYQGQLVSDGNQLTGAKALSQAYANLGLPTSLQTNVTLRSLLYGSGSISDSTAVQAAFNTFSNSPIADTTVNQITLEMNTLNSSANSLSTAFSNDLSQIQTPETLAEVAVSLEDLQSLQTLFGAGAIWPCNYQLTSTLANVTTAGGTGSITIQEPNGCAWTASTGASWLTVTSGGAGAGNGTVSYSVAPDPTGVARDAIVIVGDQLYHVMQSSAGTFVQIPGSLTQVSVGADGTLWGINSSDSIYSYNPQTRGWTQAPGALAHVSVGANGAIWGLNAAGDIYLWDTGTGSWDWIPGNLSQIAVGVDGDTWGVNSSGNVYHFNTEGRSWEQISGSLSQIAVGYDGAVWGINASGDVYRFNPGKGEFQNLPGALTQVAVGADGDVWGLDSSGAIYHFNSLTQGWDNIPGALKRIAVGSGSNVWGLNEYNQIFEFSSQTQNWINIPGELMQISVGANGSVFGINASQQIFQFVQATHPIPALQQQAGVFSQIAVGTDDNVWAVDSTNAIYHFNLLTQAWDTVPGALAQIAVGPNGDVWGVNASGEIWQFTASAQSWNYISGQLSQISVGANGAVWGINAEGQTYTYNAGANGWTQIPGELQQLSVGADSTVWGINAEQQIYRYNGATQSWVNVPGWLKQISVGNASNVWGVNAEGFIYRYNTTAQTWDYVPGNLAQVAVAFDGSVWGVNSSGQVWQYNSQSQSWNYIGQGVSQLSVGADAAVWGLGNGSVYVYQ